MKKNLVYTIIFASLVFLAAILCYGSPETAIQLSGKGRVFLFAIDFLPIGDSGIPRIVEQKGRSSVIEVARQSLSSSYAFERRSSARILASSNGFSDLAVNCLDDEDPIVVINALDYLTRSKDISGYERVKNKYNTWNGSVKYYAIQYLNLFDGGNRGPKGTEVDFR